MNHGILIVISVALHAAPSPATKPTTAASRPTSRPMKPTAAAAWELRMLGVDDEAKLRELREYPKRRRVKLAVVGQSGVSRERMAGLLTGGNTLTYHGCTDPRKQTHDTGQTPVILEITRALGVTVDLHVWQTSEDFADVARCFREAAQVADIVVLYQSFWGPNAKIITRAIRESPTAVFVSPYVEHGGRPTNEAPQGSACKPWDADSIGHFVLAAPLPRRKATGNVLTPSDRGPTDSEIVNFIAPSYHANGPGGTCPAAGTTAACAAYCFAVAEKRISPAELVELLRLGSSALDRPALASVPEYDAAAIAKLAEQLATLHGPPAGKQRKLDAPGVLSLYLAWRHASTWDRGRRALTLPAAR